jgi:hypothetical protein
MMTTIVFFILFLYTNAYLTRVKRTNKALGNVVNNMRRKNEELLKNRKNISAKYFAEQHINKGLFSTKYLIYYKMQILLDGIAIGGPVTISTETYKEIDKATIFKILDDYAKPLLEAGIKAYIDKTIMTV